MAAGRAVEAATRLELDGLPDDVGGSALAASALALAREIDDPGNSATSKSMCARAHLEIMDRLHEMAPPVEEADAVNEIESQRAKRRKRASAAAD